LKTKKTLRAWRLGVRILLIQTRIARISVSFSNNGQVRLEA